MAAFSRLAMTIIQAVNVLFSVMTLQTLTTGSLDTQTLNLMMIFQNSHAFTMLVWGVFFALHMAFLGYLVYKSGFVPRILGVVIYIVSACYFVQNFGTILLPQFADALSVIGMVSMIELAFPFWLVIKGVREN